MRITDLGAFQPRTPADPRDWRTWLGQIAVYIETADGPTGVGVGGGGAAGVHVIETVLRPALVGRDCEDIQALHAEMNDLVTPFGRRGISSMAVSGVDLALWDLRGKIENKPVWRLLGAERARTITAYKTGWSPKEVTAGNGFRAIKLQMNAGGGRTIDDIEADFRTVRSKLGPHVQIMGDAFMRLGLDATLLLAERLEPLDIGWIEEPLPPDDLDGYARLRDECPVPIAGGEHVHTSGDFEVLARERLLSILQPDVCWCGGLTELLRIYELGVEVCPHRGCEVWALHAISAVDPSPLAESGRPWMSWVAGRPEVVEGSITPGEGPGFGVRVEWSPER